MSPTLLPLAALALASPVLCAVRLDQTALNVLPLPFTSRNFSSPYSVSSSGDNLTATASEENVFQIHNPSLAQPLLGDNPSVLVLVYEEGYAFAHEAPVYFPDTDDFYFCSDAGGKLGRSNATTNNVVFRVNLGGDVNKTFTNVEALKIDSDGVQMTNGGTNYQGNLLLANSGRTEKFPGTIALVNRQNPSDVKVLINNVAGKQFNAPNDVVVHPTSGAIFFTDAWYAEKQVFRPSVDLPLMTWRLDPTTGELTPLTDPSTIRVPNGLVFNPQGTKLYIVDTSPIDSGAVPPTPQRPASIYEFDVLQEGNIQRLANRRLFAWPETGIADGLRVDSNGNLYAGTGDGMQVWSKNGERIFKLYMPQSGAVNMAFTGKGRIAITAQEKIFLVQLDASVEGPPLWDYPRQNS